MKCPMQCAARATHGALRIVAGLLFLQYGGMKLLGWFGGLPAGSPPVVFPSEVWFAGALELFGGTAILLGLFTRPVAFLLCGEMAVAYFQGHFHWNLFWPIQNGGAPAVLFCFIFLFLAGNGAGACSIDCLIRRARTKPAPSAGESAP